MRVFDLVVLRRTGEKRGVVKRILFLNITVMRHITYLYVLRIWTKLLINNTISLVYFFVKFRALLYYMFNGLRSIIKFLARGWGGDLMGILDCYLISQNPSGMKPYVFHISHIRFNIFLIRESLGNWLRYKLLKSVAINGPGINFGRPYPLESFHDCRCFSIENRALSW